MNVAVYFYFLAIVACASCTILPSVARKAIDDGSSIIRRNLPLPTTRATYQTTAAQNSDSQADSNSEESSSSDEKIYNVDSDSTGKLLQDVNNWLGAHRPQQPYSDGNTNSPPTTAATSRPGTTISRSRRLTRDVGKIELNLPDQIDFALLLDFNPLGNLSSVLAEVDFSVVTVPVPLIPALPDLRKLPVLPGLRENIESARNLTTRALGGVSDLRTAIQKATDKAIHNLNPADALSSLCYTILRVYYNVAQNCPLHSVGSAVLQDGLLIIGELIKSAISVASRDASKVANMLGYSK